MSQLVSMGVASAYEIGDWGNFLVAATGVAAVLTGLVALLVGVGNGWILLVEILR